MERLRAQLTELRSQRNTAQTESLRYKATLDSLFREMHKLAVVSRQGPAREESECWREIERLFKLAGYTSEG